MRAIKYRSWTIRQNGCFCATNPNYGDSDTFNGETIEDVKQQIDDDKDFQKEQRAMERAMQREFELSCKRRANGWFS